MLIFNYIRQDARMQAEVIAIILQTFWEFFYKLVNGAQLHEKQCFFF